MHHDGMTVVQCWLIWQCDLRLFVVTVAGARVECDIWIEMILTGTEQNNLQGL